MKRNFEASLSEYVKQIREQKPLVHCITNIVTVNDCANILLAIGASPTMAHHPLEVAEVTAGCRALVLNMGAMENLDAMKIAGQKAKELSHPIVLDPVGAAGASYRREACFTLIKEVRPDCIRGNYSEIKALAFGKALGAGVDALEGDLSGASPLEETKAAVKALAQRYQTLVIASGEIDILSDGRDLILNSHGSKLMSHITGAGCMSSALLGAFLSINPSLIGAAASLEVMGICGEIAEEKTKALSAGSGTFHIQLIDAVSLFS